MTTPDFVVASDGGALDAGGPNAIGSWSYVIADKRALENIRAEITRVLAAVSSLMGAARTRVVNRELRLDIPLLTGKGTIPNGTNNAGEITGALMGLSRVRGQGSVAWYTDSKYTLESVTKWCRSKNRNDKSYLNGDLIFALADLYDEMSIYGLIGRHVHSHNSMPVDLEPAIIWYLNHRADLESTAALNESKIPVCSTPPAAAASPTITINKPALPWPIEMKFLIPFMALKTKVGIEELTAALELFNITNRVQVNIENVSLLNDALWGLEEVPHVSSIFGEGIDEIQYHSADWWKKINLEVFDRWVAHVVVLSNRL